MSMHLIGHASRNNQTWQFEIVMEGYNFYYRKEWGGYAEDFNNPSKEGFYNVSLAMNDFGGVSTRSWGINGSREGGHYGEDGQHMAAVARRLWQGNVFRGVRADELRELLAAGHDTEEFITPISRENFPVLTEIKWRDNTSPLPAKTTIYIIESVEFTSQHNSQFFTDARKKYFNEVEQRIISPQPTRNAKPSESQTIAAAALEQAKVDRTSAVAKLRAALNRFPLDQPLGAWNQSVLLTALWQIQGLEEKDELVTWFYKTLTLAPKNPMKSRHGYMDHGPWYLLFQITEVQRPEIPDLLMALVADKRFNQTDGATLVELMERSDEGFPIPKGIVLDEKGSELPKGQVQQELLPLWRNILRRHYGLPEEPPPSREPLNY